jgi:5'(3')-deoxyribonucleotidase
MANNKMKKTIAIDFDGVIHKYSKGWQDGKIYDEPVEGALEAIITLLERDYKVSVFTTREDIVKVKTWIIEKSHKCKELQSKPYLFWFDRDEFNVTNQKPIAIVYIDDRGIRFTNWKDILNYF